MWQLQNLTFYLLADQQSQGYKTGHSFTVLLSKYATVGNLYKKGILFMNLPTKCLILQSQLLNYAHLIHVKQASQSSGADSNWIMQKQQPQPASCSNLSMRGPCNAQSSNAVGKVLGIPKLTFIFSQQMGSGVGNKSPSENLNVFTVKWLLISLGSNENQLFHFLFCMKLVLSTCHQYSSTHPKQK